MIPSILDIFVGLFVWAILLLTAIGAFPVLGELYDRTLRVLGRRL